MQKGAKSLDFVIGGAIKKLQVYQKFYVGILPPACKYIKNQTPVQVFSFSTNNLIGNETSAQIFSCKFCKIFKNIYFGEQIREAVCSTF